jgi:hypothetical protein
LSPIPARSLLLTSPIPAVDVDAQVVGGLTRRERRGFTPVAMMKGTAVRPVTPTEPLKVCLLLTFRCAVLTIAANPITAAHGRETVITSPLSSRIRATEVPSCAVWVDDMRLKFDSPYAGDAALELTS